MTENSALPSYTQNDVKARLLASGASGTVYALVMPESENALKIAMDGCEQAWEISATMLDVEAQVENLDEMREKNVLSRYREPWTSKQDAMHEEYFDRWIEWASPVVSFDEKAFPCRYPTAGASEGIVKVMAEHLARCHQKGTTPYIHIFEGEYEGFGAFARGMGITIETHRRENWRELAHLQEGGLFWISQPSAIDGMVWEEFDDFCAMMDEHQQGLIDVIPDLSYVGAVAREYGFSLDHRCIPSFLISHSKPFGGYYNRCGGVFSRHERPTLFGNRWFKNLLSLAWGVEMMKRHSVYDLPRKYRDIQKEAARIAGAGLALDLDPADVMLLATAKPSGKEDEITESLLRGSGSEQRIRVCVTPLMSALINPRYAPGIALPTTET